jgi:hypothetical protein
MLIDSKSSCTGASPGGADGTAEEVNEPGDMVPDVGEEKPEP